MQKYERDLHRKARYTNHHIFSLRCRDEGVIPVSLRIKPPVKTKRRYEIGERAFLLENIQEVLRKKCETIARIDSTRRALESNQTTEDFQRIDKMCREAAEKTFDRTRQNHLGKLGKLTRKMTVNLRHQGLDRCVINRTQRTLLLQWKWQQQSWERMMRAISEQGSVGLSEKPGHHRPTYRESREWH